MNGTFLQQAVPLSILAVLVLILDGIGLVRGWAWLHNLGIPFRRGRVELPKSLAPRSLLPSEPRGANAIWLDDRELGYWSGTVRISFRDSFGFQALRGMGIATSGTLRLDPEHGRAEYTERIRFGPLVMILVVSAMGSIMWSAVEVPVAMLLVPPLMFITFYGFFVVINARHLVTVRKTLQAP